MNIPKNSYKPYVFAIKEQLEQHISGLNELSDLLAQRPLTFNEKNASERSIQVIIESAIGVSKHYLKSRQKPVSAEARANIERVYELLSIKQPVLDNMRGAIGMRNAIIHDYLNLDTKRIEKVLLEKKYLEVQKYVIFVSSELVSCSKSMNRLFT